VEREVWGRGLGLGVGGVVGGQVVGLGLLESCLFSITATTPTYSPPHSLFAVS